MSDESRKKILERRATFVAAAIASLGVTASCDRKPGITAEPCLSVQAPVEDSAPSGAPDAGPEVEAEPMPCLSPMPADSGPKPTPMPCLKMPPPKSD